MGPEIWETPQVSYKPLWEMGQVTAGRLIENIQRSPQNTSIFMDVFEEAKDN
jgi:hypothetical protein